MTDTLGSVTYPMADGRVPARVRQHIDDVLQQVHDRQNDPTVLFPTKGVLFARAIQSQAYQRPRSAEWQRTILVSCPLCGDTHQHGAPWGQRGLIGDRARHCPVQTPTMASGYEVVDLTGAHVLEGEEQISYRKRQLRFIESGISDLSEIGITPEFEEAVLRWAGKIEQGIERLKAEAAEDGSSVQRLIFERGGPKREEILISWSASGIIIAGHTDGVRAAEAVGIWYPVKGYPSGKYLGPGQFPGGDDWAWAIPTADREDGQQMVEEAVKALYQLGWRTPEVEEAEEAR